MVDTGLTQGAPSPNGVGGTPAIRVRGVEKVYGATVALAGADLVTHPGEIHGLLGENGAGKSTLVRILAGFERHDAGEVELFGQPISDVDGGARDGLAFIHQDLGLFPNMSVAGNIALVGGFRKRFGLIDERATVEASGELLSRLGMKIDPRAMVGELTLADQTAVAIARALSRGVRLIVLDEPTAYLEARQVRSVLNLLGKLKSEGVACLLITHRASDVLESCDSLTVLRDGCTVAQRAAADLTEPQLIELISGKGAVRAVREVSRPKQFPSLLELGEVVSPGFGPISLTVGAGEIVGLCGLADAGTVEVGRAIFGLSTVTSGEVEFDGRRGAPRSPADAVARGVAYIPAERRREAIAEELSVRENLFMRPSGPWFRPMRSSSEGRQAADLMTKLNVYPHLPEQVMTAFSGGNQQKVVLAKWLRNRPKLLILNDPTAGVDLSAKADIHDRLRLMAQENGFGVLLISTDFSEIADLSDRVYVMRRREIVAEIDGARANANDLVSLAYGGSPA